MGNFSGKPVEKDIIIKCSLEEMANNFSKDYAIVWHDPNSKSEENQHYRVQLEEFCKVFTFTKWEEATDFIKSTKATCYVVTSGTNGELLVKEIDKKENVFNIYVFCGNKEYHETWAKNYPKITCVETHIEDVLDQARATTSDSIQYCRLVLKDIERAIKEQYQTRSKKFSGLLYRRAYLSEYEWSNLKKNTGREIEMHGFMSASKERSIALSFIKSHQSQRVFITIIVPKGPNEEEQGFAEIEEFSNAQKEKEILFNVRSRFTILETEDETSEFPHRHLVLLYGAQSAQGFRRFVAEKNPIRYVLLQGFECTCCKVTDELLLVPLIVGTGINQNAIFYCKKCLGSDAAPFLCVPAIRNKAEKSFETKIKGCLLVNANQNQTPFYGYKCCHCQAKKQKVYFICTDCCVKENKWCESCSEKTSRCRENGHRVLLEASPFSFWFEPNELNHLEFQNGLVEKNRHVFEQGQMYFESHEYEKAIEYYSLWMKENEGDNKTVSLAASYNNLGRVYNAQGEYKKALEYYFKSLDIWKPICGDNDPNTANPYTNIGSVYSDQGEYKKALEYHLKSLNIYKSVCGENHPNTAHSYNHIGGVYDNQGEYKKALEYHLKSLNIKKSVYGDSHPNTAGSYHSIRGVYSNQREYEKVLEYYFKSLDIWKSIYGDNHPDTATSYNNIGNVYNGQGEHKKALEYYLKSLDVLQSVYDDNHLNIAGSYNNIGCIYSEKGEYKKALEYHLKFLSIRKSVYEDNNPESAISNNNIGIVFDRQGEYKKALEYYLKSLDIFKSVDGDDHTRTRSVLKKISEIKSIEFGKQEQ